MRDYISSEMGCKPSRNTSTVHPSNSNSNSNGNTVLIVQETPDVPSTTPESPSSRREETSSDGHDSHNFATELQQRLQAQTTTSRNSKPRLQRQSTVTSEGEEETDADSLLVAQSSGSSWEQQDGEHEMGVHINNTITPVSNDCSNERHTPQRPAPPPALPPNSLLRFRCGTDSQIEFFKMLDKKINDGPDYVESKEKS